MVKKKKARKEKEIMVLSLAINEMALPSFQNPGSRVFKPGHAGNGGEMGSFSLSGPRPPMCDGAVNGTYVTETAGNQCT